MHGSTPWRYQSQYWLWPVDCQQQQQQEGTELHLSGSLVQRRSPSRPRGPAVPLTPPPPPPVGLLPTRHRSEVFPLAFVQGVNTTEGISYAPALGVGRWGDGLCARSESHLISSFVLICNRSFGAITANSAVIVIDPMSGERGPALQTDVFIAPLDLDSRWPRRAGGGFVHRVYRRKNASIDFFKIRSCARGAMRRPHENRFHQIYVKCAQALAHIWATHDAQQQQQNVHRRVGDTSETRNDRA